MRVKDWLKKTPFVSRRYHNQQTSRLSSRVEAYRKDYESVQTRLQSKEKQHEQELKFFNELARRLMTLAVVRERKPPFDFRVEMTISPELLFQVNRSGVGRQEMDMIAHRFAELVRQELTTINLSTLPDYIERIEQERQRFDRYWSEH